MPTMTELKFTHVGMGNVICATKIVAMIRPKTECGKRYLKNAKTRGTYIDACLARPMKTLILMDDGRIVGSCITAKTLMKRCNGVEEGNIPEEDLAADKADDDVEDAMEDNTEDNTEDNMEDIMEESEGDGDEGD